LLGCTYEECPDDYAKASPITHVDSDIVPPLVWHGTEDPIMDVEDANKYIEEVEDAGVDVTAVIEEGAGHAETGSEYWEAEHQYLTDKLS